MSITGKFELHELTDAQLLETARRYRGKVKQLTEQTVREGKLILKMKDDISFYKRKVNTLSQKLKSRKR